MKPHFKEEDSLYICLTMNDRVCVEKATKRRNGRINLNTCKVKMQSLEHSLVGFLVGMNAYLVLSTFSASCDRSHGKQMIFIHLGTLCLAVL